MTFEPAGYGGSRSAATAIYFLPHPGERSRWHPVRSDELWFWHSGGPLALRLGGDVGDVGRGEQPQALVPGGTWQAAEPAGEQPVLA